jgi:hypothetical protein
VRGRLVEIEILIHGHPAREYLHGVDRYVEGRVGSEYTLRVRNLTARRLEVVLSVDGLSIMNGETSTGLEGGYVLSPFGSIPIPGWHRNNSKVANFEFGAVEESYAVQTGQAGNIGVIGCRVFLEKQPKFNVRHAISIPRDRFGGGVDQYLGATRGGDCECLSFGGERSLDSKGIGTKYGRESTFEVREVSFERESLLPAEELVVRYADRDGLRRIGVDLYPRPAVAVHPESANPFPAAKGCPAPVGWTPDRGTPRR